MTKLRKILVGASIAIILTGGVLYVAGDLQMNRTILGAVNELESPYYKGIASTCFKKNKSEYRCCLSSVQAMSDLGTIVAPEVGCGELTMNQLKCPGSFKWCIPPADMAVDHIKTQPQIDNENEDKKACVSDMDCVAAICCHATDVTNTMHAPRCNDTLCTLSCETILDCGQGVPVCNNGMCDIDIEK